ncbi:MAG: hypothetical protein WBG71_07165 [Leeuwenhoekiella sp.]
MKFLKKNLTKNWLIKLFKLTDQSSVEKFEMGSNILFCNEQIEQITGVKAKSFDINNQSIHKPKAFKEVFAQDIDYKKITFKSENVVDESNRESNVQMYLHATQFRELFVQEVFSARLLPNDLEYTDKSKHLSKSPINKISDSSKYWINTPLKKSMY